MSFHEVILNLFTVCAVSYTIAQVINYSEKSARVNLKIEKEKIRKLHILALSGDRDAALKWSEDSRKLSEKSRL